MKIAYVVPSLKDSGLTRIAFFLAESLVDNFQVKIFYFKEAKDRLFEFSKNIDKKKLSLKSFDQELNIFDIVHCHGIKPDFYAFLYKPFFKGKIITTVHGFRHEELYYYYGTFMSWVYSLLWNFVSSHFDLVIFTTDLQKKFYQSFKKKNTRLIYNGFKYIDKCFQPNFRKGLDTPPFERSDKSIYIATLSNLESRKGIDQLIRLLTINNRVTLLLVGGSNKVALDKLKLLASREGVIDRCHFYGFLKDPWDVIIRANIFVFPSRSEGFGIALAEAASLGMPIICSNIPTFRELFDDNEVTFFEIDDIQELNKKLDILNDPDKLMDKARQAKMKVEKNFTLQKMCSEHIKAYFDILNFDILN
jgi:glycosyltransferase involved in cell wall biosynthesis